MRPLSSLLVDIWRRFRWRAALYLALMLVASLLDGMAIMLLFPLLGLVGIGSGMGGRVGEVFADAWATTGLELTASLAVALVIAAFVLQNLVYFVQAGVGARLQHAYVAAWRQDLLKACLGARWQFFAARRGGELINSVMEECGRLGGAFYLLGQLAAAALVVAVYGGIALWTAWSVAAMLLGAAGVVFLILHPIVRRSHSLSSEIARDYAGLTQYLTECLAAMKMIKATAVEEAVLRRTERFSDSITRNYFWVSLLPHVLRGTFETVIVSALAIILVVGAHGLGLDPALILVILAMFVRLYPRLSSVQQNLNSLYAHLPALERVRAALAGARLQAEPAAARDEPPRSPPHLRLEGLEVRYGARAALAHVSLDIPAARTVALVGPSGSGKSTLVDALLGLAPAASGRILVDGRPLEALDLRRWRARAGYVTQETYLFNASVADNILWERPGFSRDDVEAAARRAQADGFIRDMPDGYDTLVGDRGVRLSGGQRQRLGLARALLEPVPLLILDEATSALDSRSEQEVVRAIDALRGQMTIVVIAHRLSTARHADLIHVLEGGRLVESGDWAGLLARGGLFRRLWDIQTATVPEPGGTG